MMEYNVLVENKALIVFGVVTSFLLITLKDVYWEERDRQTDRHRIRGRDRDRISKYSSSEVLKVSQNKHLRLAH